MAADRTFGDGLDNPDNLLVDVMACAELAARLSDALQILEEALATAPPGAAPLDVEGETAGG